MPPGDLPADSVAYPRRCPVDRHFPGCVNHLGYHIPAVSQTDYDSTGLVDPAPRPVLILQEHIHPLYPAAEPGQRELESPLNMSGEGLGGRPPDCLRLHSMAFLHGVSGVETSTHHYRHK